MGTLWVGYYSVLPHTRVCKKLVFTPAQRTGEKRFIAALTKVYSEHITKLKTYNAILRQIKCYFHHETKDIIQRHIVQFNLKQLHNRDQ
jgi:hypothetical protein